MFGNIGTGERGEIGSIVIIGCQIPNAFLSKRVRDVERSPYTEPNWVVGVAAQLGQMGDG